MGIAEDGGIDLASVWLGGGKLGRHEDVLVGDDTIDRGSIPVTVCSGGALGRHEDVLVCDDIIERGEGVDEAGN